MIKMGFRTSQKPEGNAAECGLPTRSERQLDRDTRESRGDRLDDLASRASLLKVRSQVTSVGRVFPESHSARNQFTDPIGVR